jgi:hypothetical protein
MLLRFVMALLCFCVAIVGQEGPVTVHSATSQEEPGCLVEFSNTRDDAPVRFVLRRNGQVIGTSAIVEWDEVANETVTVLFSLSGNPAQPQPGDTVEAEVVGDAPSGEVTVN